jgi:hypothetical protein
MTLDTINNGESGYDARMKINAVIGAVNATLPIVTPGIAYVETSGNDSTGAVGDPTHPFASLQAAYNAGARVFDIGVGTFAGLTVFSLNVMLIGKGAQRTYVSGIIGHHGNIYGNGKDNITVGEIVVQTENGIVGTDGPLDTGSSGVSGSPGENAYPFTVSGCHCSGDVILQAGSGASGGAGASSTTGAPNDYGGTGGNGGNGSDLFIVDCVLTGYAVSLAGNGGNGGHGGNSLDSTEMGGTGGTGGNAGLPGTVNIIRSQVGGFHAGPATKGNGGSGGSGNSNGNNGADGNAGLPGSINTQFSQSATDVTAGETTTYRASLINGYWIS